MGREVIVIVGPTCSGKSFLAIKLALLLNTEIISADSRQFYKQLKIGTAKPSQKELNLVKHHFIDSLNIEDDYNANKFANDAEKIIQSLLSKDKVPIVVGGSGLYIKALIDGISESADAKPEIREQLLAKRKEFGNEYLYKELQNVDPVSAGKMLPQNWKRVIRALEVFYSTGIPIWKHHTIRTKKSNYNFVQFGLRWEREILYKNIENRVDKMIDDGLVDEVKKIIQAGYDKNLNALNTVGYKEIIAYLNNEYDLEREIELIKRNPRRYAKRQLTWFNADKRIEWFDVNSYNELDEIARQIALKF